jgi:hypothetical protein
MLIFVLIGPMMASAKVYFNTTAPECQFTYKYHHMQNSPLFRFCDDLITLSKSCCVHVKELRSQHHTGFFGKDALRHSQGVHGILLMCCSLHVDYGTSRIAELDEFFWTIHVKYNYILCLLHYIQWFSQVFEILYIFCAWLQKNTNLFLEILANFWKTNKLYLFIFGDFGQLPC